MSVVKTNRIIEIVEEVLKVESEAIMNLIQKLSNHVEKAVDLLYECKGKVIVTGLGKPGFIARKISATLNSTGTVSTYIHPAEAIHGDLGLVTDQDVVIAISNSGQTDEIINLIPFLRRQGAKLIALTGNMNSTLAKHADIAIDVSVEKEACPIGLAPTASTTASLAMGDALAMALLDRKGFKEENFAEYHPGGNLGKRLLLSVKDIMRTGERLPVVKNDATLIDVLLAITKAHAGAATIVNDRGALIGVFTDGDLRRHIHSGKSLQNQRIGDLMHKNPFTIQGDSLAVDALEILKKNEIDELIVIDNQQAPIGILDVQDLLSAGIV